MPQMTGCSLDPSDLLVQPPPEGSRHPLSCWHLSGAVLLPPQRAEQGSSEGAQRAEGTNPARAPPLLHRSPCHIHEEQWQMFPRRKERKAGEDGALEAELSAGGAGS